jgi:hypothetical protein
MATAAVCLTTALVYFITAPQRRAHWSFFAAAALSIWLSADDLFMLHEVIFPKLGIAEPVAFLTYAALGFAYFSFAVRHVVHQAPAIVAIVLVGLGGSVAIDILTDTNFGTVSDLLRQHGTPRLVFEDGLKFIGIGGWFALHLIAALKDMARDFGSAPDH